MKTYSFKLCKHPRKFNYLRKLLKVANEVWNTALKLKRDYYQEHKKDIGKNSLRKQIKDLRNSKEQENGWKLLGAQTTQDVIIRIYNGYQLFFLDRKLAPRRRRGVKPPKFKPLKKQQSFTLKQNNYALDQQGSTIRIGKHSFKYHKDREVQGKIKTVTVKKNRLGEFFVFITTDEIETTTAPEARLGNHIGFDFGLKQFLTASTNGAEDIQAPLFFKTQLKEMQKLSRQLSSKKKGSHNRGKARRRLAMLHKRIANRRKDFHWKTALHLVQHYEIIYLETLNLKGMKALWGRKINDLGFYQFLLILKYLAVKYNCKLVFIDRFFPSSKTCSCCGAINKELELHQREWDCPGCKVHHDRDRNAAVNIETEGKRLLAKQNAKQDQVGVSTCTGVPVRLPIKQEAIKLIGEARNVDRKIPLSA